MRHVLGYCTLPPTRRVDNMFSLMGYQMTQMKIAVDLCTQFFHAVFMCDRVFALSFFLADKKQILCKGLLGFSHGLVGDTRFQINCTVQLPTYRRTSKEHVVWCCHRKFFVVIFMCVLYVCLWYDIMIKQQPAYAAVPLNGSVRQWVSVTCVCIMRWE